MLDLALYTQFRREIECILTSYIAAQPTIVSEHASIGDLINLSRKIFTKPCELQDAIRLILAQDIPSFNDIMSKIYVVYANYAADSQYDRDAGHHAYLVTQIKTICASAKALCDANKDISAAEKLYQEARDLCDITEAGNTKRKKTVEACHRSCDDHTLGKMMGGKFGNLSSQESELLAKIRATMPTGKK